MTSVIPRGDHGLMLMPRSTAMMCLADPMSRLPAKYVAKGVTIIMADVHAVAWLEALEAQTYKQGTGTLCTQDGKLCCLGVEQEVNFGAVERRSNSEELVAAPAAPSRKPSRYTPSPAYLTCTKKMYYDADGIRCHDNNPAIKCKGTWMRASHLNDNERATFPQIAALLRNHIAVYPALPEDLVRFK